MIYALRVYANTTVCVFPFIHVHVKLHVATGKMVYGEAPQLHHMYVWGGDQETSQLDL